MPRFAHALLGAAIVCSLAFTSKAAHALSASAHLDWSRFSLVVADADATDGVDPSGWMEGLNASASDCLGGAPLCPGQTSVYGDWFSTGELTPTLGGMAGIARFDPASTFASISGFSPSGYRSVTAMRTTVLYLFGASHVHITIPYTLSIDATGTSALHGSFAYAVLTLAGYAEANYFISSPWDGTTTRTGVFTLDYHHTASSSAMLLLGGAFARLDHEPILPPVVAVPEPATYALMLGGVALLAGWRRRRA